MTHPRQRQRRYPACRVCDEPVTCGQRNRRGRSIHFACQLTDLSPEDRHPGLPREDKS